MGYALKLRKRPKGEIKEEVKKNAGAGAALWLSRAQARRTFRRAEAAGGHCPVPHQPAEDPALDEPLGALDLQLRRQMQQELKRLQKKLGITFIYITHDQEEALNMSDRIAVMRDGQFDRSAPPPRCMTPPNRLCGAVCGRGPTLCGARWGDLRGPVEFWAPAGKAAFLRRGASLPRARRRLAVRGSRPRPCPGKRAPGLPRRGGGKSFAGGMLRIAVERWPAGREFICRRHGIDSSLPPGTPYASPGSRTRPARWRGGGTAMSKEASTLKKRQRRGEFLTALPLVLFTLLFIVGAHGCTW